jgi:hypothetical protein
MAGPIAQWRNDLARLDAQLDRARERVADLRKPGAGATDQQIAQARLGELAAVKQFNDFLATAKQGYDIAKQYERRLSNGSNLSALERQQLEITRDALNARAGEFQQFANDNKLFPASAKPVQANGKIYYDGGHTEWDHAETQMIELCHDMPLACLSVDAGPGAREVNKREFTKPLLRAERGLVTVPN